jgi:outer membrane protein TolC
MKYVRLICFSVLLFFHTYSAYGITLKECIDLSLKNSKVLLAYENLIKSNIYSHKKDQNSLLPQLSATGEMSYLNYDPKSDFKSGFEEKINAELSLDLKNIIARYPELSRMEIEKSTLLKALAENEIRKNITQDYYKLYILLKKKPEYLNTKTYFDEHVKDIEYLKSMGMDVKLDLIRAQMQRKSINISIQNINSTIKSTLLSLNSMMDSAFIEKDFFSMDDPLMDGAKSGPQPSEVKDTEKDGGAAQPDSLEKISINKISLVYENRLSELDLKIAEEAYKQSKLYSIPSLHFGVDHNFNNIDPNTEANRIYLAISLEVFDFAQKMNEEKQLKYNYEYQKNIYEENRKKLKLRIEQLIEEIDNAQAAYLHTQDNLEDEKKILYTARTYYRQGKLKETDLLDIFSEYLSAEEQAFEAQYNYLYKKAELDYIFEGFEK